MLNEIQNGKLVGMLVGEKQQQGRMVNNLANGVYTFKQITNGMQTQTGKLVVE